MFPKLKRTAVILLLANWLLPTGIALAVVGHQLLHHGTSHLTDELCDELTHGHRHDGEAPEHDHLVVRNDGNAALAAPALATAALSPEVPRPATPAAATPHPGGSRCRSSPLFTADCSLLL